jgi:hypothetical protein
MTYDRREIFARARASHRVWRNLGAPRSWSECLLASWRQARRERDARARIGRPPRRSPFPKTPSYARAA